MGMARNSTNLKASAYPTRLGDSMSSLPTKPLQIEPYSEAAEQVAAPAESSNTQLEPGTHCAIRESTDGSGGRHATLMSAPYGI
jgi:hypothetical protein